MHGQFDDELTLPTNGGMIEVRGPLRVDADPDIDGRIDGAVVHFLIVQGEGDATVTAIGQGHWKRPDAEWTAELPSDAGKLPDESPGTFSTTVDNGRARGIGLAIAIKPGKVDRGSFVPPAFEALTWCADFRFVPDAGVSS